MSGSWLHPKNHRVVDRLPGAEMNHGGVDHVGSLIEEAFVVVGPESFRRDGVGQETMADLRLRQADVFGALSDVCRWRLVRDRSVRAPADQRAVQGGED